MQQWYTTGLSLPQAGRGSITGHQQRRQIGSQLFTQQGDHFTAGLTIA